MGEALSSVSAQWESLFSFYAAIAWVVGVTVLGWMVYSLMKYRSKAGLGEPDDSPKPGLLPAERGTVKVALILTLVVTGILMPISIGTIQTVDLIEKPPRMGTMVVKVEAFQWGWKFTYPDGRESVGELRVPRGEVIIFEVTSLDVFHNMGIIDFRVKVDAIPGKVNRIWLQPERAGEYELLCFEFCGVGHSLMRGKLIVMEPEEFARWYEGA